MFRDKDENKKFKLIYKDKIVLENNKTLYRIISLKNFAGIKVGEVGGYVEREGNLSQKDNCWIYGDAMVFDDAYVKDNASVCDSAVVNGMACVSGKAMVYAKAHVYENAKVYDYAKVGGSATVSGFASIRDQAEIAGTASISGNANIFGRADVYYNPIISGEAKIFGNARISGPSCIGGHCNIFGDTIVSGPATICGDSKIQGGCICETVTFTHASIMSNFDYIAMFGVGNVKPILTFYVDRNVSIRVNFGGNDFTLDEFGKWLLQEYKSDKKILSIYVSYIGIAKIYFEKIGGK